MELVQQIINDLIDKNQPLDSALLKTKVLASRLQNQPLLDWVNGELEGYKHEDNVPKYRVFKCAIEGDFIIGNQNYTKHAIPTIGLDDFWLDHVENIYFTESVSALESRIKDPKATILGTSFSAEVMQIIQDNWRRMALQNRRLNLYGCRKLLSMSVVHEMLNAVRNKLLNFMLEIDKEFGNTAQIEDLRKQPEQITHILKKTIINTGDGSIVSTGDNASINATISVTKGNQQELEKYLQNEGLSSTDTSELIQVIDNDDPNLESQTFGEKVSEWIAKMMAKAANGVWDIGLGAAGSLLATAIQLYYGWTTSN